jgi:general secretion pathway protein G
MVGTLGIATPTGSVARFNQVAARRSAGRGFSLIELVIVVVIIGIIAAIAVPRMSRGSQGAADSALSGNLSVLRNAIDLYQTEHQTYPASGGGTFTDFERQLTKYTDAAGGSNAGGTKDAAHPYGPYLRRIPPLPVGTKKGNTQVRIAAPGDTVGSGGEGWIYFPATGELKANTTELDSKDVPYSDY